MAKEYYLGCPVWSCPEWKGRIYRAKAPKEKWLNQYSESFNSVEGNSTFYGIPRLETIQRWAAQTQDGFKFALKFPRAISHDKRLVNAALECEQFLKCLDVLHQADRLGPSFLQMGPGFDVSQFQVLREFLGRLPRQFPYAVEVRHASWFQAENEPALNQLLTEYKIDRVIFDSRCLYSAPPSDDSEVQSQQRKPKVPIRTTVTGANPMLRFIGRNQVEQTQAWIEEWVPIVANWIQEGLTPFVFTHTPDDQHAPEFARMFHNELAKRVDTILPIDEWPFETPRQQQLF